MKALFFYFFPKSFMAIKINLTEARLVAPLIWMKSWRFSFTLKNIYLILFPLNLEKQQINFGVFIDYWKKHQNMVFSFHRSCLSIIIVNPQPNIVCVWIARHCTFCCVWRLKSETHGTMHVSEEKLFSISIFGCVPRHYSQPSQIRKNAHNHAF